MTLQEIFINPTNQSYIYEQYRDPKRFGHNENHFGPSHNAISSIQSMTHFLTEYPQTQPTELISVLAEKFHMNPNHVAVGNGSSDLIQILYYEWILKTSYPEVICLDPAFAYYPYLSKIHKVHHIGITPRDATMRIHSKDIIDAITPNTSAIFITNPNNPTGILLENSEIEFILQHVPKNILVVIDEAYVEYVIQPNYESAIQYVSTNTNLVVLRTFSKAYGLAALRIGYAISNPNIIERINKHISPYHTNRLAEVGAIAALYDQETLEKTVMNTHEERNWLFIQFQQLSIHTIPSQTNFLLITAGHQTQNLCTHLTNAGFDIRYEPSINALRVTVGTSTENIQLIKEIKAILSQIPVGTLPLCPEIQEIFNAAQLFHVDTTLVKNLLENLIQQHALTSPKVTDRIVHLFAEKLLRRTQRTEEHSGNLYTTEEQLRAFNTLLTSTPFIRFGHAVANHAIIQLLLPSQQKKIHIVDLGIGSGKQWHDIIPILAKIGTEQVTITGIDIPSNINTDEIIKQPLLSVAKSLEYNNLTYHHIPKTFETLTSNDFKTDQDTLLIVNAAFALHHLNSSNKHKFVKMLSECPINLLTLIEPDTEHDNIPFPPRLRSALLHYGSVLDAINNMVTDVSTRQIIEQGFFGREIENVLHHDDSERFERHQESMHWHWLMLTNNFSPVSIPDMAYEISNIVNTPHEEITYQTSLNTTKIIWKGTPIISATLWARR